MKGFSSLRVARALLLGLLFFSPSDLLAQPVAYDIVYVRAPRYGDITPTDWPEVFDPIRMEPGADLMLLHPGGTEEVLFPGGNGSVVDPAVSFDGQWVFFSYFPDLRPQSLNSQRRLAPVAGADIYKIHLGTRQVVRLTQQVWTPPSGAANWSANHLTASAPGKIYLGYGIFNLGPCPLPGGRVMFTSSRDGYLPNKGFTFPNLRLYVMDADGGNVEKIGHLNIGSALHPTVLADGRVMFTSYEAQGLRDQRLWGLWAIWPDGRRWEPLMSAFSDAAAMHFQTQLSDRRIAVVEYYNLNNNGFGTLLAFNPSAPASGPPFGDPNPGHATNPAVRRGLWFFDPSHPSHLQPRYKKYPFSPPGLLALSGFTHGEDEASSRALDGNWAGKVTHPSGAPGNDVLLVWSPGPANDLNRPTTLPRYDGGLYVLRAGTALDDYRQLVLIKNNPLYNEMQPRAVVPYSSIYGIPEPTNLSWLPNDGSASAWLPAGTPFGLIGTASFYNRNTTPGIGSTRFAGLDPFNTSENGASSNWGTQGADAGKYTNADIFAVRIVALEGVAHRSYGPGGNAPAFLDHADAERLRVLGEIPLRKPNSFGVEPLDGDGNPDTSFLARIPADTPFTFQTLDKDGLVLNVAQTWHQVRPGEVRTNCGGCHAHARNATNFATTAASQPGFAVRDLVEKTPILTKNGSGATIVQELAQRMLDVEYYRDIKPILQRSCVPCHSTGTAQAGLVLNDTAVVNGFENTWHRLANDQNAQYGIPPVIPNRTWRQTNASRYVRQFQSRRSLLVWKIFGRRLDGWSNADHPTETVPGNPATLPPGAFANDADIDYTGTIMPPPGSGVPPLSENEKMMIARWIDLGAPISSVDPVLAGAGWFSDELKPTLTVSLPRAGPLTSPLTQIRIGAYDSYSGLDPSSISVLANFTVNGRLAGSELKTLFTETPPGSFIWALNLSPSITSMHNGLLTVRVKDQQGNWSVVDRRFGTTGVPAAPATLTVIGATNKSLTFSWSPSLGVTGYRMDLATDAGFTNLVPLYNGRNVGPGTTHTAVGLSPATTYYGRVRAYDGAGMVSPDSPVASGTTTNTPPPPQAARLFYTLTPCRVLDTRSSDGPFGGPSLLAGLTRLFRLAGRCGIPASARAVSVNVTVTGATGDGHLTLYLVDSGVTSASSINFRAGQTRANNAVTSISATGDLAVRANLTVPDRTVHFILDVNGYFE